MAICHGHDLGSFAAFGFTNLQAPFFAGTKLASMKASRTSIASNLPWDKLPAPAMSNAALNRLILPYSGR